MNAPAIAAASATRSAHSCLGFNAPSSWLTVISAGSRPASFLDGATKRQRRTRSVYLGNKSDAK